jgi:hypothetical protein
MQHPNRLFSPILRACIVGVISSLVASCSGGGSVPTTPRSGGSTSAVEPSGSLKAEIVSSDAKGNLAIQVPYNAGSGQSHVTFVTLPGALCHRGSDTSQNPWTVAADFEGHVGFFISATDGAEHQDSFVCAAGGASQTVSLSYVSSSAQLPSAVSAPVPMPSESQIESTIASLGFDPRTAGNNVLEAHNLPPRAPDFATNPAASEGWMKAVFSPTTSLITNANQSTNVPNLYYTPYRANSAPIYNGTTNTSTSPNWSGYDDAGVQGTYNTVRAYWTVPTVVATSASPAYSAVWAGIDGGICADGCTDTVFQDGTEQEYYTSGGVGYYYYEGWWEDFPSAAQDVFSVNPGDEMYGTFWKNIENDQVYGQYYLKDITTGATYNSAIVVGSALRGDSVEWIIERPCTSSSCPLPSDLPSLADYQSDDMTQAELISGDSTLWYDQIPGLSSYDLYQITMTGNNGDHLSAPTDPNPGTGGITFTWLSSD